MLSSDQQPRRDELLDDDVRRSQRDVSLLGDLAQRALEQFGFGQQSVADLEAGGFHDPAGLRAGPRLGAAASNVDDDLRRVMKIGVAHRVHEEHSRGSELLGHDVRNPFGKDDDRCVCGGVSASLKHHMMSLRSRGDMAFALSNQVQRRMSLERELEVRSPRGRLALKMGGDVRPEKIAEDRQAGLDDFCLYIFSVH